MLQIFTSSQIHLKLVTKMTQTNPVRDWIPWLLLKLLLWNVSGVTRRQIGLVVYNLNELICNYSLWCLPFLSKVKNVVFLPAGNFSPASHSTNIFLSTEPVTAHMSHYSRLDIKMSHELFQHDAHICVCFTFCHWVVLCRRQQRKR